jgi:myo-inositol-1(or 4)-monophosphatase
MNLTDYAPLLEAAMRATRPRVLADFAMPQVGPTKRKEDGSAVTELDTALEREIGGVLLGLDSTFGVIGEESGELRAGSPTWHLDPLDGTANFSRRLSVFGSQVVLIDGTEPLFAAVYEPLTDLFTWAARGAGTWHAGRRVELTPREPRRAVVHVDVASSGIFMDAPALLGAVRKGTYKTRALGSIAIHLRDVAVGAADAYLGGRATVSPLHDMAPGTLLVREAGGIVSDGRGGDPLVGRTVMLAAGGAPVHDWLCEVLAGHLPAD